MAKYVPNVWCRRTADLDGDVKIKHAVRGNNEYSITFFSNVLKKKKHECYNSLLFAESLNVHKT